MRGHTQCSQRGQDQGSCVRPGARDHVLSSPGSGSEAPQPLFPGTSRSPRARLRAEGSLVPTQVEARPEKQGL